MDIRNIYSELIENNFKNDYEKLNNYNENRRLKTTNNLKQKLKIKIK